MLFDTHMHTRFSTDSQMHIDEAVAAANKMDLGITLTEHLDLAFPQPNAFLFNIEEYFQQYGRYRNGKVLLGIEIGMRADCLADNRRIVASHPFDYVIGSIHVVDSIDIYTEDFYLHRTKQEVYQQYFDSMIRCLETYTFIHSLGHIDYIARYARYQDPEIYYPDFSDRIDQVLQLLVDRQQALEINTRRLSKQATVESLIPIYRRFFELGGRLITVGSDAHNPKDIGRGMDTALDIAECCGLKAVWFQNGQPRYIKR